MCDSELCYNLFESSSLIPIPFKTNAGIVLWSLVNATLGAYISFSLFNRLKVYAPINTRRTVEIASAALSLSLGCWACELTGSRISLHSGISSQSLKLDPAFVVLSLLLPCTIIFGAFVMLDVRCGTGLWKAAICAIVIGLSVGFMHYSLYFSMETTVALFSTPQIIISLLLCISASLFSCLYMTFVRLHWTLCIWIRLPLPLVFGCAVTGANYVALDGTMFFLKASYFAPTIGGHVQGSDIVTMVVPALTSFIFLCLIATLKAIESYKDRCRCAPRPRLVIASIAFTSDGRVLVDDKGILPLVPVNLDDLPKNILKDMVVHGALFHWLLALSFNWSILEPFSDLIRQNTSSPGKRRFPWSSSASWAPCSISLRSPQSTLKVRLMEAIAQLAGDLDVPIANLGFLYDRTLETGTHLDMAEFLLLSENASSEYRNVHNALKRATSQCSTGLMLFFVRDLPQNDSASSYTPGEDWAQKYASKGYRLKFMRRFRDTLAEVTGASQHDVDDILRGCHTYVANGTKSVLEPRGTYISLYSERLSADGYQEVLVYDFAKHQIPSYRLDIQNFSQEMRAWLQNATGITALELIQVCRYDAERAKERSRYSGISNSANITAIHSFADFKIALAFALEQLMHELSFLGPDLAQSTRLTSQVLDVYSKDGDTAHTIILNVEHSDSSSDVEISRDGSRACCSSESAESTMPSIFTYTPKRLLDASQLLIRTPMDQFKRRTTRELHQLLSTEVPNENRKRNITHMHDTALVSSFSLDTISETASAHVSSARQVIRSFRSCWSSLRSKTGRFPFLSRGSSVDLRRGPSASFLSISPVTSQSASRFVVDASSHGKQSITGILGGKGKQRGNVRQIQLCLPQPVVLAEHHRPRRVSTASSNSAGSEVV